MRVNIKARIPMHLYQEFHTLPLVLTIETAHGLAARCEHRTTAAELMWTLDQKTDINAGLLDRFRQKLRLIEEAHLSDVEVSDEVLDMFGFFRLVLQFPSFSFNTCARRKPAKASCRSTTGRSRS